MARSRQKTRSRAALRTHASEAGHQREYGQKPDGAGHAIGVTEPLVDRVSVAGIAAATDSDTGNAKCQRYVCVGGGGRVLRVDIEGQGRRHGRLHQGVRRYDGSRGTLADELEADIEQSFGARFLGGDAGSQSLAEVRFRDVDQRVVLGPEVEFDPTLVGDGVDARAASVACGGQHGTRLLRQIELGDAVDELADGVGGVRASPVGPRMAAGAADGDPEAPTAEGAVNDAAQAAAIDGDECAGVAERAGVSEEVFDASQIAGSFLADGEDEKDGALGSHVGVAEGTQDGQRDGEAAGVVGDAGSDPA